ncbi:MATE family efflux transporter [Pseudemcibacter aquimaris]|uniref:MATE family efflux transporter n=1 Tax=Pseudemcibacter aquimaris TaxID=2857064 RepID=UPI00201319E6|nr:MATE family efflux transporter [Pseudemcibacter aquimaris]MCC3861932.1 MATE family efflux transporter [Pseudemcibacter aquimaris]WDU58684.1 MATE family efflux transporter [Pseudemcibacter aquimaris]
MTTLETHYDKWDKARIKRQFSQLVSLSWPIILQRLGIMTLGIVDTAMVAQYSSEELAYQGLANSAIGSTLTVAMIGLMMGTMVLTSNAYGAENYKECGRVWKRSLPYGLGVGFIGLIICLFGEPILLALGQTPDIARGGGEVVRVLAFGIMMLGPMLCSQFFLEGISRPLPGMLFMLVANFLNIFLNWIFVWGNLGFDPMGAVGSAWATTIVRTFLALSMFTYIFMKLDREKYGLLEKVDLKWPIWRKQRHIGYAAGLTNTIEHLGFAALYIFAGYISSLALGSLTIAFTIFGVPFMVCYGVAAATSVRVGIAMGRGDHHDMALAGICGIAYNGMICLPMMFILYFYPETIVSFFTTDAALIALTIPMIILSIWMLFLDTAQTVMGNALRGAQDIWMPAIFYVICYSIVMIPLAWYLTFTLDHGQLGLIECVIVASLLSFILLTSRFFYLTMVKKPVYERG